MTKSEAANAIARLIAPNDKAEQARLRAHHMGRTVSQVRESLARQQAIAGTTTTEIRRHCQVSWLPGFRGTR